MEDDLDQSEVDAIAPNSIGSDGMSPADRGRIAKLQVYVTILLSIGAAFGIKGLITILVERPVQLKEMEIQAERELKLIEAIQSRDATQIEWPEVKGD